MCYNAMRTKECFKTCTRGWHIKGTKFVEKEALQHVRKKVSNLPELGSSHEFPTLQQMQGRNLHQKRPEQAHQGETPLPDVRVPPPTYRANKGAVNMGWAERNQAYKCTECPAMFQDKNDIKHHMKNVHTNTQPENSSNQPQKEASFLELMQKSLEQILPKTVERILQNMATVKQEQSQMRKVLIPNQQNGPNVQQVGWELIMQNLQ